MRPSLPFYLSVVLLVQAATPALSQDASKDTPLAMTYEVFEASVDHIDLPSCPSDIAAPNRFCRMTAHRDGLNVFAFSDEGDQPLVAVKTYETELLATVLD